MKILAIETSCDETAICIMDASGTPEAPHFRILGNALISQAAQHAKFGGVYPNLAKREHQQNLVPILTDALKHANELKEQPEIRESDSLMEVGVILAREPELHTFLDQFLRAYEKPAIDCIAVTYGPGLEPALWVGINFAKALAHAWQLPLMPVNHMEGHIAASVFGSGSDTNQGTNNMWPAIALLVSGGHTELVKVSAIGSYEMLGATRDDAAGECFDKCARLLELPYPGGPEISRLAAEARHQKLPPTFALPRPMIDTKDYDFSFSGLKTAVLRTKQKHGTFTDDERRALCREIEDAIVDVLVKKTLAAAEAQGARTIVVGGGVSANAHLRERLTREASPRGFETLFPPKDLSTDNAVMIAMAAYPGALKREFVDSALLRARGNLSLGGVDNHRGASS
jgi:N6-L-threonylcarbamoyladenine synthase